MSSPKFSVVLPVYSQNDPNFDRKPVIGRTIRSVLNQQYPDWELILVNDGCSDDMPDILEEWAKKDSRIKVIHQEPQNRAIARNNGMDNATGEWICWLDSDDEYTSHYLRAIEKASRDLPEYNIFNFESIIYFPDHHSIIREAFKPKIEGNGHEWFRSGSIATGSFVFKRELWASDPKYRIPDECSPYGFAAASGFDMRLEPGREDIEFKSEEAFTDHKLRVGLSLGNPWGDDFLQYYLLTRDNISKALDIALYIQYPRSSEDGFEVPY
ncbi:MAG: glycosyltransferase family 2 protein [Candidatus Izemoplasmatales bacterium]